MGRSLAKVLSTQPPKGLLSFLEDLPLTADEMAEEYYELFGAIVIAVNPRDTIDWLHVKCVVDLTWEIKRERTIKTSIITLMQQEVVLELLKSTDEAPSSLESHVHRVFDAKGEAKKWAVDLVAAKETNTKLAARGYPPSEVLAKAYMRGANQIDAVDKRTASYELRRMVALREIERRDEKFARQLGNASKEIIDGEFSEATHTQS
jgi:hypothetical protein